MDIAVIGGGVGGLCLAQGLKKAGVRVTVYERDRSRTDRLQGYRLHINAHGEQALRDCLPDELWQRFLDTTGSHGGGLNFVDHRLRRLLAVDPSPGHHSVSRITLRQILLSGVEIEFDKRFERYEQTAEGIVLHFADGTTATCDVLVGADGTWSAVRAQYLPHARVVDTGVVAIAGKLFLDGAWAPEQLIGSASSVIAPKNCGMFLAAHDGLGVTDSDDVLFDNARPYLMWAYAAKDLSVVDGVDRREIVADRIRDWHPDLVRVVRDSHAETVSWWPIRTSTPIDAWRATRVTLLGDAIHSMTPMRGIGANTALRDARLLCRELVSGGDVVHAIGRYEERMRDYGFAAVKASVRSAKQFASGNSAARSVFKGVLRFAQAVPPVKRAMFADIGVD